MRLWSFHPKYLDSKGLVALWREGLLAKKVLEGKTKGYKFHPQLVRFQNNLQEINFYLHCVCDEADARGYFFDRKKLTRRAALLKKIPIKSGQLRFEWQHLLKKLEMRDPSCYTKNIKIVRPLIHPLFKRVKGGIESWEVILISV